MNCSPRTRNAILVACSGLATLSLPAALLAEPPRVFLLDAKQLDHNRQKLRDGDRRLARALKELKRDADDALSAGPYSVVEKDGTPPSGDKHDYMSVAPYWWPNPDSADRLPYIRRDGRENPDRNVLGDRRTVERMADAVETFALAHYFTEEGKYARRARRLICTWFLDPATRMNPNFRYAQAIPGRNTGRGNGLIESRYFMDVVDAVGLIADSRAWTGDDERELCAWFAEFLRWMLDSELGRDEASQKNNHGTYYDLQVAVYALYLDEDDLARNILQQVREKRIALQIEPDGRQPLELARTKAWSYSVGNLSGLMKLAMVGERMGVDLWAYETDDGRSIRAALDFLMPYSLGGKKWPYEQLGGFSRSDLHPLLRRAAVQYPEGVYRAQLAKIRLLDPDDRANLLYPAPPK